jgi:TolB-like protein/Flp pilus assembly protein TadD
MSQKSQSPAQQKKTDTLVRQTVESITNSKAFRQIDRLQRFLVYVTEETLQGRGDLLKEYPIGVEVFGRDTSFDPRMDPIVRVQARRLRLRLTTYYTEEGQNDPIVIEMPKGGYTPTFRTVSLAPPAGKTVSAALAGRNTVAVQPFEDLSQNHDQKYFCNGLAREIIQALARTPGLIVKSGWTQEAHNSAAMVIEGSVRKKGNILRITTHVVDALRSCYIWTETIDRHKEDEFNLQEEVASRVANVLRDGVGDQVPHATSLAAGAHNLATQNLCLQGRYHLEQRTEHGLQRALEFFIRAIEEDPRMAAAYAGLSDTYNLLAHYGVLAPADVWTKAAASATRAVLLDDQSSEAHTSLGHLRATQDWDWVGAEIEFLKAISLNPRNSVAHFWYGASCLASLGRLDEALAEVQMAQALDPVSSIISRNIALIHYYQRNLDLALQLIDLTIEQNPHFAAAYWTLGLVQDQRGELDEAIAAFKRAIELSPPSPRILGALGGVLAKAGKRDEARKILDQLEKLAAKRYISPFEPALINFNLGRRSEGFTLLTKAFADRCFEVITIHIDPRFDGIRSDPQYKDLFQKLSLPE